jgi:hypothetical protein
VLIDNSAIKKAVTDAVDALESAGSESALDALIDLWDECESRIALERGKGHATAEVLRNLYHHYHINHSKDGTNDRAMPCQICLDLSVMLKESLP